MAHKEQQDFCIQIRNMFPEYFVNKDVLDVGSQDINGTNNHLFENCTYTGLDVGPGKNVDVVCPAHEYNPGKSYDVIISTNMIEHDINKSESLRNMVNLLKSGGLLLLTGGGYGMAEHGTNNTQASDSPHTADFYENLHIKRLVASFDDDLENIFRRVVIDYLTPICDIRFVGIKR